MANPAQGGMQRGCSAIMIVIGFTILGIVLITGIWSIIWILTTIKAGLPVHIIEDGSIHGFELKNNHLNYTFDFVMKVYNPNSKVSIYYDSIEAYVRVPHDNKDLQFGVVEPFFQPPHNEARYELKLAARELMIEKSAGEVVLEVRVEARIRFKKGTMKSKKYALRVLCFPVVVHMSSVKIFDKRFCDTALYDV